MLNLLSSLQKLVVHIYRNELRDKHSPQAYYVVNVKGFNIINSLLAKNKFLPPVKTSFLLVFVK